LQEKKFNTHILLSETGINYINKGHNRFNIVNYPNGSSKTQCFLQLYSISFKNCVHSDLKC